MPEFVYSWELWAAVAGVLGAVVGVYVPGARKVVTPVVKTVYDRVVPKKRRK